MDLDALGWSPFFAAAFEPYGDQGLHPARVAVEHKLGYGLYTAAGEIQAGVSGRFRHRAGARHEFPGVGDWVVIRRRALDETRVTIEAVLPRRSKFSRKAAGHAHSEQIVAANVDTVFLVSGLDANFNPRRIERYLLVACDSGASPVIILNKTDLATDLPVAIEETERIASGAPVYAVSSRRGEGLEPLRRYLTPGQTAALLGSSGVGKSTLINALVGSELLDTQDVRLSDSKGRHTTTRRELIIVPDGGLLIDTPGMRELQLWDSGEGLQEGFQDIEALAADCRFRDCRHLDEPGCGVKAAVEAGTLEAARLESFQKLHREASRQALELDRVAQVAEKKKLKAFLKAADRHKPRN
jgi:ribosome biogenesis GTPase